MIKLEKKTALVLVGPQGVGKTTLAKKIASQYGCFSQIEAETMDNVFDIGAIYATGCQTVIVDGWPKRHSLSMMLAVIMSSSVRYHVKCEEMRSRPTPCFIFCMTHDEFQKSPIVNGRTFRVHVLMEE